MERSEHPLSPGTILIPEKENAEGNKVNFLLLLCLESLPREKHLLPPPNHVITGQESQVVMTVGRESGSDVTPPPRSHDVAKKGGGET